MRMLKSLLALTLLAPSLFGETLLPGAIYFDSKNTLQEADDMLRASDTDGLARLFKGRHISEKVTKGLEVILLYFGPDPGGPVEFRFPDNPTTYWTYVRFVKTDNAPVSAPSPSPAPSLPPAPDSTLPAGLPSSLAKVVPLPEVKPVPTPTLSPLPTPPLPPTASPTPKARIAAVRESEEEAADRPTKPHPPLRKKHPQAKEEEDEGVPESAKVWHSVHGHLKWYDKRNWHEVRRAIAITEPNLPTATAVPAQPAAPPAAPNYVTPVPTPYPSPYLNPVPRAVPVKP